MKVCKLPDYNGMDGCGKREIKKSTNKYILFLLIFLITIVPSMAVSIHDDLNENSTCIDCHPNHKMMDVTSESSPISTVNSAQVLTSDSIQSFATSNVEGNIILIPGLGQNWFQQGIYGLNSSVDDASWGWTFFDQNPASEYIIPSERVIQKNNIYTLLLDEGNNSNPISGANVVANVTYWIYDGTSYTSNIISVQLTEDMNRRGFYSGRFDFYGGTTYVNPNEMCTGCHISIYGGDDTQNGYFPGNYTVLIRAEADNKIVAKDISFEVTPWGCEDCHGSGSQHRRSSPSGIISGVDLDSACYLCHGVAGMGIHYDAGNPHQNTAHRTINCVDCHTDRSLNSQNFNGVTFVNGGINNAPLPQYDYDAMPLNGGVHSDLSCEECHGNLLLSNPQGGYKSDNYVVNDEINKYDPSFTTIQQFQDYYVINVTNGGPLNVEFDWTGMSNLGFILYPPNFNPRNFTNMPYYSGSTFTNKPEIYTNNAPVLGKWILQIYGYNLTSSWIGKLQPPLGELQSPINDTISSTYPIEKKDLPTKPECNSCHYSGAIDGANTEYEIPVWNPGFAHVDTNGDGTLDIQCRMCHNAMHDITVINCQNCHTVAPSNHPALNPEFTNYPANECLSCHGDPHEVGGGTSCVLCHEVISSSDLALNLGLHSSLNGTSDVDDGDCETCHFESPHSGSSQANTYYCADCHTGDGTGPNKSTIVFTDKLHGENNCTDCHVADGTYHQNDPRGSVVNLTYVNRDGTGSTTVTDCADCHSASNLDDAPFNAPAGGSHILGNDGACAGSCHTNGQPTMIQTVHNVGVGPDWGDEIPFITVPVLNTASVSQGIDVTVTATVTTAGQFHYVDGAQYRIMEGITEVLTWTSMTAVDSDFEGASEDVTSMFDTSSLSLGTYTVEVRGMAGGPPQNSTVRYYPMNGDVSLTKSATLTVQQPPGYINGTVKSGGVPLSGVLVTTTGFTDTTGPDGTYSLMVPAGTYTVTASKLPEYSDSTVSVVVAESGETIQDFNLVIKSTGSISGTVTNNI